MSDDEAIIPLPPGHKIVHMNIKAMDAEDVAETLRRPEAVELIRKAFERIHTGSMRAGAVLKKVGDVMGKATRIAKFHHDAAAACPGGTVVKDRDGEPVRMRVPDHPLYGGAVSLDDDSARVEAELASDIDVIRAAVVARAQAVLTAIPPCPSGGATRLTSLLVPRDALNSQARHVEAVIVCDRCITDIDFSHISIDRPAKGNPECRGAFLYGPQPGHARLSLEQSEDSEHWSPVLEERAVDVASGTVEFSIGRSRLDGLQRYIRLRIDRGEGVGLVIYRVDIGGRAKPVCGESRWATTHSDAIDLRPAMRLAILAEVESA